ncbi:MAG TPA: hypothetical protein VFP84_06835 [Kofleriaceae bacterium]|nr:hypothetical protein [Kofleriaceae bacterium]
MVGMIVAAGAAHAQAEQRADNEEPPVRSHAPPRTAQAQPARAPEPRGHGPVSLLLRVGYDVGGDDLVQISTSDGGSATVSAGRGATFAGGLLIQPEAPVTLELTIGYKVDARSFSNASFSFGTVPFDAILSFAPGGHRLGIGVTEHFATSLRCSGDCSATVDFKATTGLVVQWAYSHRYGDFGVRGTFIGYQPAGAARNAPSVSGSSVGAFAGVRL